jgi:cardiolipin synthase
MILSGYLTPAVGLIYIIILGLYFLRFGAPRSVGMLVQAPIYGFFIWVAMREMPDPGYWLLVYPVVIAIITWPRFPREVIPGFLDGMRNVFERPD